MTPAPLFARLELTGAVSSPRRDADSAAARIKRWLTTPLTARERNLLWAVVTVAFVAMAEMVR